MVFVRAEESIVMATMETSTMVSGNKTVNMELATCSIMARGSTRAIGRMAVVTEKAFSLTLTETCTLDGGDLAKRKALALIKVNKPT